MRDIIRFEIPEVSETFLIYLRDRMRKGEMSIKIFEDLLTMLLNIDNGLALGILNNEPVTNEFNHFKNLGYGLCEIQIIFWQGILKAGYVRLNEMFEND